MGFNISQRGVSEALKTAGSGALTIAEGRAEREEAAQARAEAALQQQVMENLKHSHNLEVEKSRQGYLDTVRKNNEAREDAQRASDRENVLKDREALQIREDKLRTEAQAREDTAPDRALKAQRRIEEQMIRNTHADLGGTEALGFSADEMVTKMRKAAAKASTAKGIPVEEIRQHQTTVLGSFKDLLPDEKLQWGATNKEQLENYMDFHMENFQEEVKSQTPESFMEKLNREKATEGEKLILADHEKNPEAGYFRWLSMKGLEKSPDALKKYNSLIEKAGLQPYMPGGAPPATSKTPTPSYMEEFWKQAGTVVKKPVSALGSLYEEAVIEPQREYGRKNRR